MPAEPFLRRSIEPLFPTSGSHFGNAMRRLQCLSCPSILCPEKRRIESVG